MTPAAYRYGFRVRGPATEARRLVDFAAAFLAYAECDPRAACDCESYLSAFTFGADFRRHLKTTGSTAKYAGPCWAPWLWFDIDRDEPGAALDVARRLVITLAETYRVVDDDLLAFFSGSKGFHVGLPTVLWHPEPGPLFHRTARRFAEYVAELAGVSIDTGIYDRVRIFRAPNSRHPKTGLHKRRLSADELLHLAPDAIARLAAQPEPFGVPAPTYRSEPAAADWHAAAEHVQREAEAKSAWPAAGNGAGRLTRATLQFIREGAAVGDRHRLCYSASANLSEASAPLPLCVALLTEAALDCGLTPTDTRRAIENGWASAQPGVRDVCKMFDGEVVSVQPPPAGASVGGAKGGAA